MGATTPSPSTSPTQGLGARQGGDGERGRRERHGGEEGQGEEALVHSLFCPVQPVHRSRNIGRYPDGDQATPKLFLLLLNRKTIIILKLPFHYANNLHIDVDIFE